MYSSRLLQSTRADPPTTYYIDLHERNGHAGELDGPNSVRATLDQLRPHRIMHGVRAIEDPELVERLREERICLDVCPTSNLALGVVDELRAHPLLTVSRFARAVWPILGHRLPVYWPGWRSIRQLGARRGRDENKSQHLHTSLSTIWTTCS
jgi:hypothetical protein